MALTPDVLLPGPRVSCDQCRLYPAVLQCRKCQRKVCNLHFCDVCRCCQRDCICWAHPGAVYKPPPGEPPPR